MSRIGYLWGPARRAAAARRAALAGLVISLLVLVPTAASPYDTRSLTAIVTAVVDADTIYVRVDGRIEKVRYIGMDTPETKHPVKGEEPGGKQATALNRLLVMGKTVRLELDVREPDRHRRCPPYLYVGDLMVNAELVRLGYAHAMTVPPNVAYASRFVSLERQAREAGRGLWTRAG